MAKGLLEVVPGRGAFVRGPRTSGAALATDAPFRRQQVTPRQCTEARTNLECEAAALAADHATPEQVANVEESLLALESATSTLDPARCDLSFHLSVVRAAGNPVLEVMFAAISGMTIELMLRSQNDDQVRHDASPQHRELAEAIRTGDAAVARHAVSTHLAVAGRHYGPDFDRSLDGVVAAEVQRLLALDTAVL